MSIVQPSVHACQEVLCKDLTNHQLAREGSVNYLLSQPVKQSEAIINLGSCIHVMCLTPLLRLEFFARIIRRSGSRPISWMWKAANAATSLDRYVVIGLAYYPLSCPACTLSMLQ